MVVWRRFLHGGLGSLPSSLVPLVPGALDFLPWLPGEGSWLSGFTSWFPQLPWKWFHGNLVNVLGCIHSPTDLLGLVLWLPGEGSWLPGLASASLDLVP